ncbi:hypothetical protein GA0115246_108667, partial [Streptomyces sp. SolWspMP-sol7th]
TLPGREALPGIEAALLSAGLRSAWRLLPDEQIGRGGGTGRGGGAGASGRRWGGSPARGSA